MNNIQLFETFINKNLDSACRFAYSYTKNLEDAEDIVNDSVIRAIRAISSLKSPQYIKTWFYKIIANTSLTYLKKKSKISYLDFDEFENTNGLEDNYFDIDLNNMIDKLNVKYKSIIVLRFFEDMSISEISQVLEVNENTIKTRLYNALKLLKIEMEAL